MRTLVVVMLVGTGLGCQGSSSSPDLAEVPDLAESMADLSEVPDLIPPLQAVTNLQATPMYDAVALSWTAPPGPVDNYEITINSVSQMTTTTSSATINIPPSNNGGTYIGDTTFTVHAIRGTARESASVSARPCNFLACNLTKTRTQTGAVGIGVVASAVMGTALVVVGGGGFTRSTDGGQTWQELNVAGATGASSMAANGANGVFLSNDQMSVFASTDSGATWNKVNGISAGGAVRWDGSKFVIPNQLNIFTSTNGTTWMQQAPTGETIGAPYDHSFAVGGQFVISGDAKILRSADGFAWTAVPQASVTTFSSVAEGTGLFVLSNTSMILSSSDTMTWTQRNNAGGTYLRFAGGKFVAFGANVYYISTDAITWRTEQQQLSIVDIAYHDNAYVFCTNSGDFYRGTKRQ